MKLSTYWDKQLFHHIFAVLLIAGQAAVLDYYLVNYHTQQSSHSEQSEQSEHRAANETEHETVQEHDVQEHILYHGDYSWLSWIIADVVVLLTVAVSYFFGRRYIEEQLRIAKRCSDDPENPGCARLPHMGILPYAWIAWLAYSAVLVGKIIGVFKTFGTHLLETDHLGINSLEFTLGGTAAIFMLFVGGLEHLATNAQKHYIRWMQHYVLLEIVDCAEFMTALFVAAEVGHEAEKKPLPHAMQDVILAFSCINLLAPAHALYRLSKFHNRHPETRNYFFLTQTLVGTVFGNIPYFIVRVMLWHQHSYITGLFAMKNLIGIFTDTQELIEFVHDLRHHKKPGEGSQDEFEPGLVKVGNRFQIVAPGEMGKLTHREGSPMASPHNRTPLTGGGRTSRNDSRTSRNNSRSSRNSGSPQRPRSR